jgi:hypothetical protein
MPTYNIFGWQKPCYLLQDGYAESFKELMETTEWASYGTESGNPQCANCMVHCGYEPSSVDDTFGSLRGFVDTVKATFSLYPDKDALAISIAKCAPCTRTIRWFKLKRRGRDRSATKKAAHERTRTWARSRASTTARKLLRSRRAIRKSAIRTPATNWKWFPDSSAKIFRDGFRN